MLLRWERDSALGKGGTQDGGEAWMEEPTTDEVVSKELEAEAVPASQDAKDMLRTGGAGRGVDAVDKISLMSGSVHGVTISRCVVR